MERRSFLQLAAAGALGHGVLRAMPLHAADAVLAPDRFGGWAGKKFKAACALGCNLAVYR